MPSAWARSVRSSQRRRRIPDSSAQLPASMISSRRHSAADGFIYPSPKTSAPCTRAASAAHSAADCIPFFSKGSDVLDGAHASVHARGQIKPPRPICPERLCRYSWGFLDVSTRRVHLLGRQPDASLDTCQARCCRRGRPERPSYCHGRSFSHAEDFWNSRSRGCLFKTFRNLGSCMQDTDRKAAQRQSSGLRMFGGR